jgi:hypothetical protein
LLRDLAVQRGNVSFGDASFPQRSAHLLRPLQRDGKNDQAGSVPVQSMYGSGSETDAGGPAACQVAANRFIQRVGSVHQLTAFLGNNEKMGTLVNNPRSKGAVL